MLALKTEIDIWLQPCINCPNNMSSSIRVTKNFIAYAKKQVQTQRLIVDSVITSWQEKTTSVLLKDQGYIDDTEFSMNPTTAYEKYD